MILLMLVFSEPTGFSVGREEVRSQKTVQVAITSDRHLQMKLDRRCSAIYYIFFISALPILPFLI